MTTEIPFWASSSFLTKVVTVGLGAIGSIAFGYQLMTAIPETRAEVSEVKSTLETSLIPAIDTIKADQKEMREMIGPKLEEGNRIACATCWNSANDSEEVKRCSCSPSK